MEKHAFPEIKNACKFSFKYTIKYRGTPRGSAFRPLEIIWIYMVCWTCFRFLQCGVEDNEISTFCKSENAFSEPCKYKWKSSDISRKTQNGQLFQPNLPGLLNAFSTLQKVTFPKWKTYFFTIQKSRSANIVFSNKKGGPKLHFNRYPLHFHCLSYCFWVWFLNIRKVSFQLGKITFREVENAFSKPWF